MRGIVNRPSSQITLVDTPGLHQHDRAINRFMLEESKAAISEVDLAVVFVKAAGRGSRPEEHEEDRLVLSILENAGCQAVLADQQNRPAQGKIQSAAPSWRPTIKPACSPKWCPYRPQKARGWKPCWRPSEKRLPHGPPFFPMDMITDTTERQLAGEFVREQAILRLSDEIPYSLAVDVEHFEDEGENFSRIFAMIYVERDIAKGILIGKGGGMLRQIGAAARKKIERLLGRKVYLDLRVKVAKRWPQTAQGLARVGYDKK